MGNAPRTFGKSGWTSQLATLSQLPCRGPLFGRAKSGLAARQGRQQYRTHSFVSAVEAKICHSPDFIFGASRVTTGETSPVRRWQQSFRLATYVAQRVQNRYSLPRLA
jgi:hypothetical protein